MSIFVVHEHWATNHHFDLRLEIGGTLKSWAVPKTIPRRKGIKRLAIKVTDHAKSYAKFEGTIPKGSYGAGKVKIWDKGSCKIVEKKRDKIIFELKGKKMKGSYALIKYAGRDKQWLLFKQ